ncbi:hypothetical protein [Rossellomorea yichunensis]|jgi:hypothetical protein|uniref:hypothetical protein n=1 Tax=Rossellomorea yichunensis TaxID=3077331 RepID=UPI0028DE8730|nr:hypothetical protein [Rossellomorea sp. YC4-1]MDT9025942.1 hypothetical protein [Rossellomorea sp. YC4-1]
MDFGREMRSVLDIGRKISAEFTFYQRNRTFYQRNSTYISEVLIRRINLGYEISYD